MNLTTVTRNGSRTGYVIAYPTGTSAALRKQFERNVKSFVAILPYEKRLTCCEFHDMIAAKFPDTPMYREVLKQLREMP